MSGKIISFDNHENTYSDGYYESLTRAYKFLLDSQDVIFEYTVQMSLSGKWAEWADAQPDNAEQRIVWFSWLLRFWT
ncbi:MAG: hypothetical protein ACLFSQ_11125, partial [Candidatus Zixiibacteriota bacterium]